MAKIYRSARVLLLAVVALSLVACDLGGPATPTPAAGGPSGQPAGQQGGQGATTEVGTPRSETLIVQTFDGKIDNADNMNPLSGGYAIWRGFRETGSSRYE